MIQPLPLSSLQDAAGAGRGDVMAVRVHAELLSLAPPSGVVEVLQEVIAQAVNPPCSVKTVYRALQDLVAAGCVQSDRFGNRPNEYKLVRDLASARIAITMLQRSRHSDMSEEMSEYMSGVSGADPLKVVETAPANAIPPMSGAAQDTQSLRARDSATSSSWSSGSDTPDTSETASMDILRELNEHEADVVLQDPRHLNVSGLILSAHIDPTRQACEALSALSHEEQLEALRRALKAREPNPDFLIQCVGTVLRLRGSKQLPSVLPLLYPEAFAEPVPFAPIPPQAPVSEEVIVGEVARRQEHPHGALTLRGLETKTDMGIRLKRARGKRTQAAIADMAGITQAALSNYEAGKRIPPVRILVALAEALGTTATKLMPELAR